MNVWVALVLACLAGGVGDATGAGPTADPWVAEPWVETVIQPYLQSLGDDVVVGWRTLGYIRPALRYGTDPGRLDGSVPAEKLKVPLDTPLGWQFAPGAFPTRTLLRQLATTPKEDDISRAYLSGLRPDTTYYYALYDGERLLAGGPSFSFRTAPAPDRNAVRFWVVGNAATGGLAQAQVLQAMRDSVEKKHAWPLDFMLYLDVVSARPAPYTFFRPYAPALRQVPLHGPGLRGFLLAPAGASPECYSFDCGTLLHVICLNPTAPPDVKTTSWLRADLEKARASGARWLVVALAHPPYSKGTVDSDADKRSAAIRKGLLPLLEAGGADVVFSGGSGIYERSALVAGGSVRQKGEKGVFRKPAGLTPDSGAVYVVAGNGGAPLAPPGRDPHPLMQETLAQHGSLLVEVQAGSLTGLLLDAKGTQRESFRIVKGG